MHRNDPSYFLPLSLLKQWEKNRNRTQFDIYITRVRQKSKEQLAPPPRGQLVCAAFQRMASSDDNWCG